MRDGDRFHRSSRAGTGIDGRTEPPQPSRTSDPSGSRYRFDSFRRGGAFAFPRIDMVVPSSPAFGFTVDLPRLDVEKMQHYAKMWDVEHTQLGKGVFEGSLFGVHTPRIQMGISHFSHAIMTQGSFPEGSIVLYCYPGGSLKESAYNIHDRIIAPNEIVILTKSDTLDLLTHHAIDLHTIVIEENLFYKTFTAFFGDTPDTAMKNKRLYLEADKIALFHQTHRSWISYLAEEFPKLTNKPGYDGAIRCHR